MRASREAEPGLMLRKQPWPKLQTQFRPIASVLDKYGSNRRIGMTIVGVSCYLLCLLHLLSFA